MAESPNLPGEDRASNEIGFYKADEEATHDERETQGDRPGDDDSPDVEDREEA